MTATLVGLSLAFLAIIYLPTELFVYGALWCGPVILFSLVFGLRDL